MSEASWAVDADAAGFRDNANISLSSGDRTGDGTRSMDRDTDAERSLVARAQKGDKDAFGALYKAHYPAIYRLARFYLPDAGEDAAAETFMRAWKGLPRYKATGAPFVSWLYAIARHVVMDELRKRKRTEPREVVPDSGVNGEMDDHSDLSEAIARLPKDQRKVIEMKYLLGLRNPEVASLLGKSVGAVNAMQWRALKALKELLGETI